MAARRRADPEIEATDVERDGGGGPGEGELREADVEAEFAALEGDLDQVDDGEGDEPTADGEPAADGDEAGGVDPILGTPYDADDAEYGEYSPDPEERQPGAAPYQFEHEHDVSITDGFTDRGADIWLRSLGYKWPKPGKPVMLADGDLFTGVGDAYPLLPVLRGEHNV